MILNNILVHKRREVEHLKRRYSLKRLIQGVEKRSTEDRRAFQKRVTTNHGIKIIAEIKKASPSEGVILSGFDPVRLAQRYQNSGADAISVLTEHIYFFGHMSLLRQIRENCTLPVLRKDFIMDPYQIWQSAYYNCDAILLISSILTNDELKSFIKLSSELNIDTLVEAHSEQDLKKAIDCGAKLLGINNRNLATLSMNPYNVENLFRRVPKHVDVVAESGYSSHNELLKLTGLGIHTFLIGTSILKSADPGAKLKELKGIATHESH